MIIQDRRAGIANTGALAQVPMNRNTSGEWDYTSTALPDLAVHKHKGILL